MKSKFDRLNDSIENIDAAIKYYLKYVENEYHFNKITRKDYLKLIKDFKDIDVILRNLQLSAPFEDKKLTAIRAINLSVKSLYDDGDYDIIFSEILKTNNDLCRDLKEKDRKKLSDLKKKFNGLSNFYQFRLSKAEKTSSDGLNYRVKGLDNFKFILEYYLSVKYNFKKIKYETLDISGINRYKINACTKMIESDESSSDIKDIYSNIRNYITHFAQAEMVIINLEQMKQLCDQDEYSNVKEQIQKMIVKYQKIYQLNKEKYDVVMAELDPKMVEIIEDNFQSDNNYESSKKR